MVMGIIIYLEKKCTNATMWISIIFNYVVTKDPIGIALLSEVGSFAI